MYRSRLEARWAVFFETMEVKAEYEPEGFDLPGGIRYLPDFYLPEIKWAAEVKPSITCFGIESKPYAFVQATGIPLLMLDGEPGFRSYTGIENVSGIDEIAEFSLDVWTYRRHFTDEHRLWAQPDYQAMALNGIGAIEELFSLRYRAAVENCWNADFEGTRGRK
jgi:hypothetical protein